MTPKILITALGFCILSCEPQSNAQAKKSAAAPTSTAKKQAATTVTLSEGQNVFNKDIQANITFIRVSEDSRCPKGTNCVWAGVGVAEVEFLGTYTRPVILKLSTADLPKKGYSSVQQFNGYNVKLLTLTPEASANKKIDKYQITLQISKGAPIPDGNATK